MPRKNEVKIYYQNAFYHIYNRGIDKREIFMEEYDYRVFLNLLKVALSNPEDYDVTVAGSHPAIWQDDFLKKTKIFHPRKNFYGKIQLIAYCLMSNHFHLLIKQLDSESVSLFIKSITTAYVMYFNKKYERVGPLFQGPFKAIDVHDENYFIWLTRYIHRNPPNYTNYSYSSYPEYLGKRHAKWVDFSAIAGSHPATKDYESYRSFVETEKEETSDYSNLILDQD